MNKLLVLDINGVLCERSFRKYDYDEDKLINFLNYCGEHFDVAIWSSSLKKNSKPFVDLIKDKINFIFVFTWYRDRCKLDSRFLEIDELREWSTIKDIETILLSPVINHDRRYNIENVIIVDNDIWKAETFKHKIIVNEIDYQTIINRL